jgi:GT2 family glycosyltransferase
MHGPSRIVIPCFNAKRWIAEAIESCLSKTYGPLEVIVIDVRRTAVWGGSRRSANACVGKPA